MTRLGEVVVATGGGAPCFYNAIELMRSTGAVVYLKTTVQTLFDRLKKDPDERPLISDQYGAPEERLASLLQIREPIYLRAHHVVQTDDKTVNAIADEVIRQLKSRHM